MNGTFPMSALQRKIFDQLEGQAVTAMQKRDAFLSVVMAGHDIEQYRAIEVRDDGIFVELPDPPAPPTDGAEA